MPSEIRDDELFPGFGVPAPRRVSRAEALENLRVLRARLRSGATRQTAKRVA